LAAGIILAESGRRVKIYEACDTVGGGTRTVELTLPGFKHDICSAIHPLAVASPYFKNLLPKLSRLEFIFPPYALIHPFDDGSAALLNQSLDDSAGTLDVDSQAYTRLMRPLLNRVDDILEEILGPFPFPPKHLVSSMIFGSRALFSANQLARLWCRGTKARGLIAGLAGHSMLPLESPTSAAIALVLGILAHTVGWPIVRWISSLHNALTL
jgi:phytoene dehydrogenase-like protein